MVDIAAREREAGLVMRGKLRFERGFAALSWRRPRQQRRARICSAMSRVRSGIGDTVVREREAEAVLSQVFEIYELGHCALRAARVMPFTAVLRVSPIPTQHDRVSDV
jgi:hypothetical protein